MKSLRRLLRTKLSRDSATYSHIKRLAILMGVARRNLFPQTEYDAWIRANEHSIDGGINRTQNTGVLLSLVIPFWNTPDDYLNELMQSLDAQSVAGWELIMVDVSDDPLRSEAIQYWSLSQDNYQYLKLEKNFDISTNTNKGIEAATGEYVVFMDHDDTLSDNALSEVLDAIQLHSPDIIYSDEDKITDNGKTRHSPYFKPDWSPHLFLFTNYTNHLSVVRRQLVLDVGGLDKEFNGSQDYDLLLRVHANAESPLKVHHIPKILYHWREAPQSTATDQSKKSYAYLAGERALNSYLAKKHPNATCHAIENYPGYFKQVYKPDPATKVYVVVGDELSGDINNSEYINKLKQLTSTNLEVAYSAKNIQQTDADVVVSISELCYPTSETWLDELVGVAMLDDVRAVSPRILTADGSKIVDAGEAFYPSLPRFNRYDDLRSDDHTPTGATWFVRDVETLPTAVVVSRKNINVQTVDHDLYGVLWSHVNFTTSKLIDKQ